ncbi:Ger(x)C family spore germination protein [Ruminiclostridium herbifermentans]|uniref:Ger(X)C family spore germination protein n=1 Tax=Ruminiclostridium herbifermentans TaxID=2488810 RepID=A0A4U7JAP3_9FIRM|nr:Ger(x)C family spore germination protein [Ruminiclostridium herbifermentans]QNU65674.1 Ger(x)C family spore germination protein [Ruminiclostridium herbifermentans]
MSRKLKTLILLLITIISVVSVSGCYDSNEVDDLAYVIAIGVDKADDNSFNLTFQTAVPKSITGGEGESTDIKTFKTDNFLTGLKKTSAYLERKINLSHTKIIVVSEEVAKEGIMAFLNGLQQNIELRPSVEIIVSSEGAQKYIESIKPKLSSSPAKHYDLLFKSFETDFLVKDTQLEDYMYRAKYKSTQPIAIYAAIDKSINDEEKSDNGNKKQEEEDKKDEESSKEDKDKDDKNKGDENKEGSMSVAGLAVFKMDKMVGKLNKDEAMLFALMTSTKNKEIEIVDPLDDRFKVLGNVTKLRTSSSKVKIINGKPQINIKLDLNVDVKAVQSDNDYDDPENGAKLKAAYEQYLNEGIKKLLDKTTKELKSDIFGFAQEAKKNFLTIDDWENANWDDIFVKSEYELMVDVKVRRQS